jgi:hypothetical protein
MNRFQPDVPKSAFACLATALTAITFAAFVAAPAVYDAGYDPAMTLAARPAPAAPIEVAISPARIDVVGVRAPDVAWALPGADQRNCKPEG